MNVYKEIKEMAKANAKIHRLANVLKDKIDVDGLDWSGARIINGCSERNGHLYSKYGQIDNSGIVDDDYYCCQHNGYCEDDFYGTVYFKTNVPGEFVAVPFSM